MRTSSETASPIRSLDDLLTSLAGVVDRLSDEQYAHPVAPFASSVGGHVRHVLDHVAALIVGAESGRIDYDQRERGTAVETSRGVACETIARLRAGLAMLEVRAADQPVAVWALHSAAVAPIQADSTLAREALFVLSHTIHHGAMLAAMCAALGVETPPRFGYAPSTVAHLERESCAPSPSSR